MVTFDRGENQTIRLAVSDRSSGRSFFNYFFFRKIKQKGTTPEIGVSKFRMYEPPSFCDFNSVDQ